MFGWRNTPEPIRIENVALRSCLGCEVCFGKESIMSYAVFRDGDRISRPFQTEGDAWDCANDAGLVENVPSSGGSVQVLDGHCVIKSCDTEFVMPANLA
jgi:hypothetical protein